MTQKIAEKFSTWLIRAADVRTEKQAILYYGMELITSSAIGVLLLIAVSVILYRPLSWCVFLLGYIPIRVTAGGYHAKSHFWCYITVTGLFTLCLIPVALFVLPPFLPTIISSIALVLVLIFSPIETQGKPLSSEQRTANRVFSLIIGIVNLIFALFILFSHIAVRMIQLYYHGIAAASVLFIYAIISSKKGGQVK